MRKSLIALAVLTSISSAALAQSSVSIFGTLDASIGNENIDDVGTTKLFSGNLAPSRIGFSGSEDMGAGLRANFALVGGLDVDDGTTAVDGVQFDRASWVGLSGGFGEVRAGLIGSQVALAVENPPFGADASQTIGVRQPSRPFSSGQKDSPCGSSSSS